MKQFGIILAVTCVGEFLHQFIPLPVPGSIYGLIIMLLLLCTHIFHIEDVRDTIVVNGLITVIGASFFAIL